jgi:hypothetical protein
VDLSTVGLADQWSPAAEPREIADRDEVAELTAADKLTDVLT